MKARSPLLLLLLAAFVSVTSRASAQTVESVLRALQERKMVLYWRMSRGGAVQPQPIEWPGGLSVFPENGEIQNVRHAIEALNVAANEYEGMKSQFIAYDTQRHLPVNLTHAIPPLEGADYDSNYEYEGGSWIGADPSDSMSSPNFWEWDIRPAAANGKQTRIGATSIKMPYIGPVTENNWRDQLRLLASCVDQLSAITWPLGADMVISSGYQYYGIDPSPSISFPYQQAENYEFNFPLIDGPGSGEYGFVIKGVGLTGRPAFASLVQAGALDGNPLPGFNPGYTFDDKNSDGYPNGENTLSDPPIEEEILQSAGGEGAFVLMGDTWHLHVDSFTLQATIGVNAEVGGSPNSPPFSYVPEPPLTFEMRFFKSPGVSPYGDLTEAWATTSQNPGTLTSWTVLSNPIKSGGGRVFSLGKLDHPQTILPQFPQISQHGMSAGESVGHCTTLLNLPALSLSPKTLQRAPDELQDEIDLVVEAWCSSSELPSEEVDLYVFAPAQGPTHRRGYNRSGPSVGSESATASAFRSDINMDAVLEGQFAPCLPESARMAPLRHELTAVELAPRLEDMVRFFVGRGKSDQNQEGWLGTRPDGFGSFLFYGTANNSEFELLFENDYTKFTDEPLGGRTFDSALRFDPSKKLQHGWPDRFSYITAWFTPRLRQVRSHDLLVDITYETPYKKVIKFFWSSQAGSIHLGVYAPVGQPFKTITLENPTVVDGLPTTAVSLKVTESGGRVSTSVYSKTEEGAPFPYVTYEEFNFSQSGGGAGEQTTKVEIDYDELHRMTPWVITESFEGEETITTVDYGEHRHLSPLVVEYARPLSVSVSKAGETRAMDCEYHPDNYTPKKIVFSGSAAWEMTGTEIEYDTLGVTTSTIRKFANRRWRNRFDWSGNLCMETNQLEGAADQWMTYRTLSKLYSSDLRGIVYSLDGVSLRSEIYRSPDSAPQLPWSLEKVTHNGGYIEDMDVSSGGFIVSNSRGWGATQSGGEWETTILNDMGGLSFYQRVSSEGVILDEKTVDPADVTLWKAPTRVTTLNGEIHADYVTSDIHWGKILSFKDSSGVQKTISGHDWLERPTAVNDGFITGIFDYSTPSIRKVKWGEGTPLQHLEKTTFSPLGATLETSQTYANVPSLNSALSKNPQSGTGTVTMDGRSKSLIVDAAGNVSKFGNGLGSHGIEREYGVEAGRLFSRSQSLDDGGTGRGDWVKTTYDGRGRVIKVERPRPDGAVASESWSYNDGLRQVTYTPVSGPTSQQQITTLSPDGTETTVNVGGQPLLSLLRSSTSDGLAYIVRVRNYPSGATEPAWLETSRTVVSPVNRTAVTIPFGNATNARVLSLSTPTPGSPQIVCEQDLLTASEKFTRLELGLPAAVWGISDGKPFNFPSIISAQGRVKSGAGSVGGNSFEFEIGADGRMQSASGPGFNKSWAYSNPGNDGLRIVEADLVQDSGSEVKMNSMGGVEQLTLPDSLPLEATIDVSNTGASVSVNGSVEFRSNLSGALVEKSYGGNLLEESAEFNADGSIKNWRIEGSAGAIGADVTYPTALSRETEYSSGEVVTETFYPTGHRASVAAPNDGRLFTYDRLKLKEEKHIAGPWSGITVTFDPDSRDRLGSVRVTGGQVNREFAFEYDSFSRLTKSTTLGFPDALVATLARDAIAGRPVSLTRSGANGCVTNWTYDSIGRLSGITTIDGPSNIHFGYTLYDARHRILSRDSNLWNDWSNITYHSNGGLLRVDVPAARDFQYAYDLRGNRVSYGGNATLTANGLDQLIQQQNAQRSLGVLGELNNSGNAATLFAYHAFNLVPFNGDEIDVEDGTGKFFRVWSVPDTWNPTVATRVDVRLRGTRPGPPLDVQETFKYPVIPARSETLSYDQAGRLIGDALWVYSWNDKSQLTRMEKRTSALPEPGLASETIDFIYDADGRRTQKTRTLTFLAGKIRVERASVLWAGWLPILETRTRDVGAGPAEISRRWFQWGPDRSGTLDGAAGIGGLMAIHEESPTGLAKRTLLPVEDGFGNIVAVLNRATGATVAKFEYGPFGESASVKGESEACPFRWQSRLFDEETQHYCFPLRNYIPRLGRFASRDPIGEAGGFNLYAYCGNDPVNRHDPLGLADYGTGRSPSIFELMFPAHAGRDDLMRTAREGGLYAGYGILTTPGKIAAHPKVQGSLRMAGGGLEVGAGSLYTAGTGGLGGWLGGGVLVLNGADNFYAGLETFRTEAYQPAFLERGITSVAGNGLLGNSLYAATQLGVGFAPTLGARAERFALSLDWDPVFAPYRGYAFTGVPLPGLPRLRVPSPEVFKMSLQTKLTPVGSPAGLFEIANTGPLNYRLLGGGVEFWADGIVGTTIQEAKFLSNPGRSPFILDSGIPEMLRSKILGDVEDEFARMSKIIADPANPLMDVEVIINDSRANQFFLDLLKKHGLNGRVINR